MRFVEKHHAELVMYAENRSPVKFDKLQVKRSRYNEDFELMLNKSTRITPSPNFSSKCSPLAKTSKSISVDVPNLYEINDVDDGKVINTCAAVLVVKPSKPVSTGLVQEVVLTDNSTEVCLSVWGTNIDE